MQQVISFSSFLSILSMLLLFLINASNWLYVVIALSGVITIKKQLEQVSVKLLFTDISKADKKYGEICEKRWIH